MNDKTLTLFCPVWGQKHLDMLQDFALPSLMLPKNLPALGLEKIYVECVGVKHEFSHTCRVLHGGLKGLPIEVTQHAGDHAQDPIHGLRQALKLCLERGTRLLLAMPDTIYSNGSISNIFNYARGKTVCVSAAHVRVNEDLFMAKFPRWKEWPNSRQMVEAAFSVGAVDVCETINPNVTDVGGIAWTKVNETTRLMLHYLPTAYLVWVTPEDVVWWNHRNTWGDWDHIWPESLLRNRRLRVIGSSDVFFAVEFESAERSGALKPSGGAGNELYVHRRPHNDACGSFLIAINS